MEDKKCIGAISLWGFEKDRLIIRFAPINDGTIRLLFYNYNDDYYKNTANITVTNRPSKRWGRIRVKIYWRITILWESIKVR